MKRKTVIAKFDEQHTAYLGDVCNSMRLISAITNIDFKFNFNGTPLAVSKDTDTNTLVKEYFEVLEKRELKRKMRDASNKIILEL